MSSRRKFETSQKSSRDPKETRFNNKRPREDTNHTSETKRQKVERRNKSSRDDSERTDRKKPRVEGSRTSDRRDENKKRKERTEPAPLKETKVLKVDPPKDVMNLGKTVIKKFPIERLNTMIEGQRVGLIGGSGSGKSIAALDIMRANMKIPVWVVCSGSEPVNQQYTPHLVNDLTVHSSLTVDIMEKLKERQMKQCEKWKIPGSNPPEYYLDPSAGIIMDDFTDVDKKVLNDPVLKWYHCISRHYKVLLIQLIHKYTQLANTLRESWSHVFIFKQKSNKHLKTIYEEFFGMFEKFEDFKRAFLMATSARGSAIVVDVLNPSNKIEDCVYYYRGTYPTPPFVCGAEWSKKQQTQMYDKNWKTRKEEPKPEPAGSKKKGKEQMEFALEL